MQERMSPSNDRWEAHLKGIPANDLELFAAC